MRKLILILGELAAGKTTLAEHISARYRIPAFTKDRIKELLCTKIGYANREENLNLSFLSFDILFHIFEGFAVSGQDLVLESNFRQHELDQLETAVKAAGYETLTILLTGDLDTLYRRYQERAVSGSRHAAHLSQDLSRFEDYASVSFAKNPRSPFGTVISIDTTLPDAPFDLSEDERIRSFLGLDPADP